MEYYFSRQAQDMSQYLADRQNDSPKWVSAEAVLAMQETCTACFSFSVSVNVNVYQESDNKLNP